MLRAHFAAEPCSRKAPVAFDRGVRNTHSFGGFLYGEPAKETQLNRVAVLRIDRSQSLQRIVKLNQIQVRFAADAIRRAYGQSNWLGSAFCCPASSRVIYKDVSHKLRGHSKELRAAAEACG